MQFGKLLEEAYLACGFQVLRRAATGGSTTTVIDTAIVNRYGENKFSQGSQGGHILFIAQTTDRAAPEGQFGEVSAFSTPTTTPTFTVPTLSAAVQSGDIYAVMKPTLSLQEMVARCNEGLRRLTERERTDTSLTTAASTLSYGLPYPINAYNLQKVEIGNNTDGWQDAPGFTIVPGTGSTTDKLLFTKQPSYDSSTAANQTLKITYRAAHPVMSIYSDYVEKNIPEELAIAICAESALEYLMNKKPTSFQDKNKVALYQNAMKRVADAKQEHPVRLVPAKRQNRLDLRSM